MFEIFILDKMILSLGINKHEFMKYFSFLIVAGVLLFTACKSGSNTPKTLKEVAEEALPNMNHGAGKFTIETPKDWRRKDTTLEGVKTTLIVAPEKVGDFRPNINIVSEHMRDDSLQSYFDKTVTGLGIYAEKFKVLEKGEQHINGIASRWVKYSLTDHGREAVAKLYVIPKDSIAYGITAFATPESGDKYFAVFDNAVSTFKVNE